ncbi:response regulator transcription factor [Deinococcus deserti]|uniref:Putative response regulator, CheY n=1 Tax=Deinococcus deserti (strain DSM 17065 / CIP 109153 / LMG 22923 / VCD115) TaxID=546414 RepID=C1D2T0_DEIDV|nr:response regulator transcription factor [Deinococcus deserti]ACO47719.1 putative response regulator, CheY [Deinococcus deserti VCD115]
MSPRILVIDDDAGVRSLLQRGLSYEGFLVETAADGETGLAAVRDRPPDLVILDVMLPGLDGLEVLSRLRRVDANLPVVMLTARDRPDEQVRGLERGADDYVTKPFSFDVLAARVRAQLRRRETDAPAVLRFGNLTLDPAGHSVSRDGREITLTAQEFRLLQAFMEQPERVQSKSVLLDRAWGLGYLGDPNVVETYVKQLRQKLEGDGQTRLIHTIRGVGYVLRQG